MAGRPECSFAYIILRYPKRSEQFIAREVEGLAGPFGPVLVYSIEEPEGKPAVDPRIRVKYLSRQPAARVAAAHLSLLMKSPARYLRTMRDIAAFRFKGTTPGTSRSKKQRTRRRTRLFLRSALIAADFRRHRVAHIHAHYAHHPAEAARRVSAWTGIPFSFTAHAKDLFLTKPWKLARLVRQAEFALTCTRDGEAHLKKACRPRHHRKILCRYHGLPLTRFAPPNGSERETEPPLILSAGRHIEKKGFDTLLSALALLKGRGREFRCVLAGDGRLEPELRRMRADLKLERVVDLPGFVTQGELAKLYRRAALFALPCRRMPDGNRDGIPNVVLEAMACGLPVVATAVGGIPEAVIPGKNGLLPPTDDPPALADALDLLLADVGLRENMGREGRNLVCREFDIRRNTRRLARLFLSRSFALRTRMPTFAAGEPVTTKEGKGRPEINRAEERSV